MKQGKLFILIYSDLMPSFTHLAWKSRILLNILHAQTFHAFFYKFMYFHFSCSLKLWQLQFRFTNFTYSNLAVMFNLILQYMKTKGSVYNAYLDFRGKICKKRTHYTWVNMVTEPVYYFECIINYVTNNLNSHHILI